MTMGASSDRAVTVVYGGRDGSWVHFEDAAGQPGKMLHVPSPVDLLGFESGQSRAEVLHLIRVNRGRRRFDSHVWPGEARA